MDRITKSMLDEYVKSQEIERLDESAKFEHFSAYSIIVSEYDDVVSAEDFVTGSGGDTGIDAIAVIVNGSIVTDTDQVDDLVDSNGYCDAKFIFVQSETSSNFDSQKIGNFGFGVSDFFSESPKLKSNDSITSYRAIMDRIFDYAPKFKKGNPVCELYYVTTGNWKDDLNLLARMTSAEEDLKDKNLFREVKFSSIGADGIQKLYTATKNALSREFNFPSKVAISEISGVREAYIGILPAKEFLKIIEGDDGEITKSLFYENVRDFQDFNPVNSEIRDTLLSEERVRFPLMNNGITIIAKRMNITGNRMLIEDFQIVNGCQSSHVLHYQRDSLDDRTLVPLRVISTDDEEVINSIVKATNRQTEVKADQLLGLSDYQKKIEQFCQTFSDSGKLYYERRLKQYNNVSGGEKTRIVTLGNLVRAFGAVFLAEPHRATRYYQTLLEQVGTNIFVSDHRLEMYYSSALMLYKLDYLFRSGVIDSRMKVARYHILLAFRIIVIGKQLPYKNSNEMKRKCDKIISTLLNQDECEKYFVCACQVIIDLIGNTPARDEMKTQSFTDKVILKAETWTCP